MLTGDPSSNFSDKIQLARTQWSTHLETAFQHCHATLLLSGIQSFPFPLLSMNNWNALDGFRCRRGILLERPSDPPPMGASLNKFGRSQSWDVERVEEFTESFQ